MPPTPDNAILLERIVDTFSSPLSPDAPASSWKGALVDGWTERDITRSLDTLSQATGHDLVALWAYDDDYGYGGDSSLNVRTTNPDGSITLADATAAHQYLSDPDCPYTVDDLAALLRGAPVTQTLPSGTWHERCRRNVTHAIR